ncbi:MAG: transposase [Polyangiaceae bacterium]
MKNATKNRIIKLVESEGIKLATVLSDVLGKSGRAMLQALVDGGQSAEQMAELARGSLHAQKGGVGAGVEQSRQRDHAMDPSAVAGRPDAGRARVAQVEAELSQRLQASYSREMVLLQTIPGIAQVIAATIVAETGADMSVFPSAAHLASWAGLAPGNHQSAGKSRKAPVRPGNAQAFGRWCRRLTCSLASATALCAPSFCECCTTAPTTTRPSSLWLASWP